MSQAYQLSFLREVRQDLLRQIEFFRPNKLQHLPRHARQKLIVLILRSDVHRLLQFEASQLLPSEVASRLARSSVLYAESPKHLLPQLSEFPKAVIHLASSAVASHIPALLLSLLIVSVACKEKDADARFNSIISILISTWPPQTSSWHPAEYTTIAHFVPIALRLRHLSERVQEVPQTWTNLFSAMGPASLRSSPNLTAAAFATAAICSFKISHPSHPVYSFLVGEVSVCHDDFSRMLNRNTSIPLGSDHTVPITLTLLLTVAGPHAVIALPPGLRVMTVHSLEALLLNMELHFARDEMDEFNVALHEIFTSRMGEVGMVYAVASTSSRVVASSANFMARLITVRNLVEPLAPMVTSFVEKCASDVTPQVAVTLANILTYLSKLPPPSVLAISFTLVNEVRGVASLLGLLIVMLSDAQKTSVPSVAQNIYDRASKLERIATITILTQQSNNNMTQEGWLEDADDTLFGLSIQIIVGSLLKADPRICPISYVRSGLELTSAFIKSQGAHFQQARQWAIVTGVPAIIKSFLGEQSQWRPTTALLQIVARLFDSVAAEVFERDLIKLCLDGVVSLVDYNALEYSEGSESRAHGRVIYIILLRFMVRCDLAVIDLAMSAIDLLLGSSGGRKQRLLRPAQIAVMGSELGRKDICVEWLLRTFNDLGSRVPKDQLNSKKENTLPSAKL